ncbi:MAG: hypothetical protein LBL66_11240 [Clostridiales bacterium]|jgi:hypothetical protein|nr:hypothetical protein [Clostridiales bacterium]
MFLVRRQAAFVIARSDSDEAISIKTETPLYLQRLPRRAFRAPRNDIG